MSPRQPDAPSQVASLPDELIAEILSWLAVKTLMRLRCVSKSWKTLISDPTFVKIHLERSERNPHLVLRCAHFSEALLYPDLRFVPLPVRRLLENPWPTTVAYDPCYRWNRNDCHWSVVGSCNGLFCMRGYFSTPASRDHRLCLWNPATRVSSGELGFFRDFGKHMYGCFKFAFGYDSLTLTYKVVAFRVPDRFADHYVREVRVFSFGDNDKIWRNIQSPPLVPLEDNYALHNNGVHLSGTINWLALYNNNNIIISKKQLVIASLDLSTETYSELLLPRGFDELTRVKPTIAVLMDCLCFYHDFEGTSLVIWQMKEFGVQASWTQLLKISYQSLPVMVDESDDDDDLEDSLPLQWLPLCLSENGDTLILVHFEDKTNIYNWRDDRVETTRITNKIWWCDAETMNYVESLVSPH